jgi:RNA polymerase sigma-70 factor (ECF subfamily)
MGWTEVVVSEPRRRSGSSRNAERAAYDAHFNAVRARLRRIAAGLVGDGADDVVQDTYVRGRDRWNQLRDTDLFEAWITRIAVRLCLDQRSAARRLVAFTQTTPSPDRYVPERDPGLRELIERLPSRERTLIVLHYGYGYGMEEIARVTSLSSVNVRTIVFRARRKLREWLEADNQ